MDWVVDGVKDWLIVGEAVADGESRHSENKISRTWRVSPEPKVQPCITTHIYCDTIRSNVNGKVVSSGTEPVNFGLIGMQSSLS